MRDGRGLVVQEVVVSFLHEAFLPAPDTGLRFPGLAHNLTGADPGVTVLRRLIHAGYAHFVIEQPDGCRVLLPA
jgi:hypothetical protein